MEDLHDTLDLGQGVRGGTEGIFPYLYFWQAAAHLRHIAHVRCIVVQISPQIRVRSAQPRIANAIGIFRALVGIVSVVRKDYVGVVEFGSVVPPDGRTPNRGVDTEADGPPGEQVVFPLFHQLTLAMD